METQTEYELVGGSHDGQKWIVRGEIPPGHEIQMNSATDQAIEIYVLGRDKKFRFDRNGLQVNPRLDSAEALDELGQLFSRLNEIFHELDGIVSSYGGPSSGQYSFGNWIVKHKDS